MSLDQTLALARALEWIDVGDRDRVFHAARATLVSRREDLDVFGEVFARFWLGRATKPEPVAPPLRPDPARTRRLALSPLAAAARNAATEVDRSDHRRSYSRDESLRRRDFGSLSAEELAAVERLIRESPWRLSRRTTRRREPARGGSLLDLRRILRNAAKHGGVPLRLHHRRRKEKERPLVLLADISGSMERTSRLLLQLFYGAVHSLAEVECFVFATRLTRITQALRWRDVDRALAQATQEVVDWSGGTRIAESLATFNRTWSRRLLRRGAVVVLASDGWERGDTKELAREMRFLHHRCRRLIWLNPHAGQTGYEPRVAGMAAALPYVDDFLPLHDLESLEALSRKLGDLPERGRPAGNRATFSRARLRP